MNSAAITTVTITVCLTKNLLIINLQPSVDLDPQDYILK